MSFVDSVKKMFGIKIKTPPNPAKIVEKAKAKVSAKAITRLKGKAEKEAKGLLADIAGDEVNAVIDGMDDVPSGIIREKLVEKAVDQVVKLVWEEVKDKIKGDDA